METLTIKLSKAHREFINEHLAESGCKSASDFIDALIRAERRRRGEERLVQLVKEADESGPATPMTNEDWADIRRRAMRRLAGRKAQHGKNRQKARSSK